MIIESMKFENNILAPNEGYILQKLLNNSETAADSGLLVALSYN
jgi:biotin carboxyl carrier protein